MTTTTTEVKLLTLTQRRSARGTEYLQDGLGGLSVVGFRGKPTEWGETWELFVSERSQKARTAAPAASVTDRERRC
jgi:hypothetical protein